MVGDIYTSLTKDPLTISRVSPLMVFYFVDPFVHSHCFLAWPFDYEMHVGGVARQLLYFGHDKIIILVEYRFYRSSVKRDVARVVLYC